MKKLILPFFVLLIGVYCGYYLFMEDYPPHGGAATNMALRVHNNGSALECTVSFYGEEGGEALWRSSRQAQHLAFYGLPEGTRLMLINYSAGSGSYKDDVYHLEYDPGEHLALTIDPVSQTVVENIAYRDYLLGFLLGAGPLNILYYLYSAVMYYILWIVVPFILIITGYTLLREYLKGLRRRFAGSVSAAVIGIAALIVLYFGTGFFPWTQTWPARLRELFFVMLSGYPLYFVAWLVLDEDKVLGAEYRLLDDYFTYEEYQLCDRRTANGFKETWRDRGAGGIAGWLFGALLMPLCSWQRIILYYVTPFMYRSRTWVELTPIEEPGTPLLFERLTRRYKNKDAAESPEAGDELAVEAESAPCAATAEDGRKKRRRRRPRRKAPWAGIEEPAGSEEAGDEVFAEDSRE